MNALFNKILEAQIVKAANWEREADGFEALYVELVQEGLNPEGASLHSAKQYAQKVYTGTLKNKMLKVEF